MIQKTFLKAAIAVFAILSITNIASGQISVSGGLNLATLSSKFEDESVDDNFSNLTGFHAGVSYKIQVGELFSVEPGVNFVRKGTVQEYSVGTIASTIDVESTVRMNYIDVPIYFNVHVPIGDRIKLLGSVGEYVGFGLSGKVDESTNDGTDDEWDLEFGGDDGELQTIDFGLSFGAGLSFDNLFFRASYDLGVANISNYNDDDTYIKNRNLKFTLGYRFGKE